jgi:hypothetical protein
MQPGLIQRDENDRIGLGWLAKFRWLRSKELGRLMWPTDTTSRVRADRVIRGWIERRLVIVRQLPDGAGRAIVLSSVGAAMVAARTGKDWGEQHSIPGCSETQWRPPKTWRHELLAAGALACLHESGFNVLPEPALRRLPEIADLAKIPDGLAWRTGQTAYWLEVENSEKTARRLDELADWLAHLSAGSVPALAGIKPTCGLVAFDTSARDSRGHRLDHQSRIITKIQKRAKLDVPIAWATLELKGHGVETINVANGTVAASATERILAILNARGWQTDDDIHWSTYNNMTALTWEADEFNAWAYQLERNGVPIAPAELVGTITEAKRGCAQAIAAII